MLSDHIGLLRRHGLLHDPHCDVVDCETCKHSSGKCPPCECGDAWEPMTEVASLLRVVAELEQERDALQQRAEAAESKFAGVVELAKPIDKEMHRGADWEDICYAKGYEICDLVDAVIAAAEAQGAEGASRDSRNG